MITKEQLQRFIDKNSDRIVEILPGGLKDARGKWILVCPVMDRFDLDFSKVGGKKEEITEQPTEEVVEETSKKSTKKSTKKSKKK